MKQCLVIVVVLTVVANSQCGLIDGFLGTVKNTTHSIKSNVGGVLHYSKGMVFGSSETNASGYTVTKPGIVGTISHKIHDVSQGIRNEIRHIFSITDDAHGGLDAIDKIRNNITKNGNEPKRDDQNEDGTGLIDIRTSMNDLSNLGEDPYGIHKRKNAFNPEVGNGVDNVVDTISKQTEEAESSLDSIKQSTNDFINDQKSDCNKNLDCNKLNDGANKLKSNLDNTLPNISSYMNTGKEKATEEIKNSYNNINNKVTEGANKIKNNMNNAINDAAIHFRDETEDAAGAVNNAYKKVDFDATKVLGDTY